MACVAPPGCCWRCPTRAQWRQQQRQLEAEAAAREVQADPVAAPAAARVRPLPLLPQRRRPSWRRCWEAAAREGEAQAARLLQAQPLRLRVRRTCGLARAVLPSCGATCAQERLVHPCTYLGGGEHVAGRTDGASRAAGGQRAGAEGCGRAMAGCGQAVAGCRLHGGGNSNRAGTTCGGTLHVILSGAQWLHIGNPHRWPRWACPAHGAPYMEVMSGCVCPRWPEGGRNCLCGGPRGAAAGGCQGGVRAAGASRPRQMHTARCGCAGGNKRGVGVVGAINGVWVWWGQ